MSIKIESIARFLLVIAIGITPIYNIHIAGHSIGTYLYLAVISVTLLALIVRKRIESSEKNFKFVFLLLFLMSVSIIWSPTDSSVSSASTFLIFSLLIISTELLGLPLSSMLHVKRIFVILSILLCAYMLWGGGSSLTDTGRMYLVIGGSAVEVNYLCYTFILPIAFLSDALFEKNSLILKLVSCTGILFILFTVLSSGSRGGLISLAVTIFTILITRLFKRENLLKGIVGLIAVIALLLFVLPSLLELLPDTVRARFDFLALFSGDGNGRIRIWSSALSAMWEDGNIFKMLFGRGYMATVAEQGTTAHNLFVEVLYGQGIVGLLLLLILIGKIVSTMYKRNDSQGLALCMGHFIMSMTVSGIIYTYFWANMLVLILATDSLNEQTISVSTKNRYREKHKFTYII